MPATTTSDTNIAIVSATLVHRSKKYFDAITKQLPFFFWMMSKGRYVPKTGLRLEWPIWYKLKGGELSYQGFDVFAMSEFDDVTLAAANWKFYHDSIVVFGPHIDGINMGPEQVYNFYDQKEKSCIANLQQKLSTDEYSDGTGNGGKNITGLGATVPQDPTTGTLYGFNRATAGNEFMRSQLVNQGSGGNGVPAYTGTPTVYTMKNGMDRIWQLCGRLKIGDKADRYPDLILCSEGYFRAYGSMLNDRQRFTDVKTGEAGFHNLKYMSATMIDDQDCPIDTINAAVGGLNPQTGIYLNSAFIEKAYMKARNFQPTKMAKFPNQDVYYSHVFAAQENLFQVLPKHGRHIGILEPAA
ncbi:MAG: phage major capsid protein [Candidatus Hydrogenedentes bacterium]|nr:phage major capsid protein [Candidatus Hydrogenedentota bacterium]